MRVRTLPFGLTLASFALASAAQTPVIHESGWTLRTCVTGLDEMRAIDFNPLDGCVWVASDAYASGMAGVYKVDASCTVTQVVSHDHANGLVVDPQDGDVFFANVWGGAIRRIAFGATSSTTWVSGFHGGDDDPFGMDIAPEDYAGPVLQPGEALVVDPGYNGGPKEIWKWSPDAAEGELLVLSANASEPTDVAITRSAIYFVDWAGGTPPGRLWRIDGIGSAALVATQSFLPAIGGIAVDPLNQDLLLRAREQVLRFDPASGSSRVIITLPAGANGASAGIDVSPDGRLLAVSNEDASTLYVFERALVSSSGTAAALAVPGTTLSTQLTAINSTPPVFDPQTWQPVWRHADLHAPSSFTCGQPGVVPQTEPYLQASTWLAGADEVTLGNCSSAWYRFTFTLPPSFSAPRLFGRANVDDQGVLFLNGHRVTGLMTQPGCEPTSPADPCYALFDAGHDRVDAFGTPILTSPTPDEFSVAQASWFRPGQNELVFAVCGDAAPFEPTGLEFAAALHWDEAVSSYCTAKVDSIGCVPVMSAYGQPSASLAATFDVSVQLVQSQRSGILFYGYAAAAQPWNGAWLCVQPPIVRTPVQSSGGTPGGGNCTGVLRQDFNLLTQSGVDPMLVAGTDVFVQAWYRDPAGTAHSGVSAGLRFRIAP